MPRFGEILFSGSRFIFWALSPFLLLFAVAMPLLENSWTSTKVVVVCGLDACAILLILMLFDSKRFWWAGRGVTAIVFLAFVAYLADEVHSGKPWRFGSRSESTPLNALVGLVIIGLPCLRYAIMGSFLPRSKVVLGIRRHLLGACPNCEKPLEQHDWAMFACTVATKANKLRLEDFFKRVQEHDWQSMKSFSDWDATQNDMEAYVVRCASGGVVFVLWNPYELYESDQLYMREIVSSTEMSEIKNLLKPTSWQVAAPHTT